MKLKLLVIVLLVAAGAAAVAYSAGGLQLAGSANATQYLTSAATTGDVTDSVAATGTIAANQAYDLGFGAAPVLTTDSSAAAGSGTWTVTEVKAEVGKAVKRGDVLAKASTADLEEQLLNAQASLAAARLQEKQARQALKNASGTDAIRQAKVGRYNAANARREAQQQVDDLKTQIRYATLTAPIDGTITAVNIARGLDSTGTAISIASSGYEVTADVVESDVSSMSVGQDATVTVGAIDATIQGTVSAIAPTAGDSSGSGSVVSYPVTVDPHGRAVGPPGGHDRGHHDRHRVGHQRADDPRRGPPRHGRQLPGPGHGRRRHADRQGGRGRARHRAPPPRSSPASPRARPSSPARPRTARRRAAAATTASAAAASAAAASSSTAAAPSSRSREHRPGDGAVRHAPAPARPSRSSACAASAAPTTWAT